MTYEGLSGTITKEYTVWCGFCPAWHQEGFVANQKAAEEMFKRIGWKKAKGEWGCPKCNPPKKK